VTGVLVEEGDDVAAGQTLLEIDPARRKLEVASSQAGLAQAIAQVAESKRELDRVERLSTRDAASVSRLDEARTQLSLARSRQSAAEAQLGLARRALADSTILAPFDGVIARRYVSAGEYLSTGKPIFDVVALDPIEVEFSLAEVDSARVRIGAVTGVRVAPFPGERFEATVTVISPTIDPRTRTLRVKAEIPNPDGRLRPGLFAHADLGIDQRKDVTMVPEEALVLRADGTVLFRIASGNRVERLVVETGVHQEGLVEVKDLLAPGEHIVVRGQRDLVDGGLVSLRTRDGRPVDDGARVAAPGLPPAGGTGR
jgi:membrane fusion protein (multidrug efflux system)